MCDTQGVGGLCLPSGFHAIHTSTSGMSHNQTHWLLLNWPARPSLAHLGPAAWKHCPCNLLSLCSCLQLSTVVCHTIAQTQWVSPDIRPSPYQHCKNSFSQSGWRGPSSWETAMTYRCERVHLRLSFSAMILVWRKSLPGYHFCIVLLFDTAFTIQMTWTCN